jgi:hypothetical protein
MLSRRLEVNPQARQVLCPSYKICLDLACDSGSTGFDCRRCAEPHQAEPIDPSEGARCGALLREIFYHGTIVRKQPAKCIRCGRRFTFKGGAGASPLKFCPACNTLASDYYADYDAGRSIEIRGAHRMTVPLADEVGFDDD